ncbi:MAG: Hsp20/alpha crystallin family protein [Betaproteobacteria bacterium]
MNALMTRSNLFDDLFKDLSSGYFVRPLYNEALPQSSQIRLDVKDDGAAIVINADLPGVKKEDIHVHVQDSVVTLGATLAPKDSEGAQGKLLHSERYAGTVSRSLSLPCDVDESRSSAKYEDGVLTLTLPKAKAERGARLQVQ